MFDSILRVFGFGAKKELKTTVRLEVIQKQIEEFNESKKQINEKINTLENKTDELGEEITKTLEMTRDNQSRLSNIESSLERIISLSEAVIVGKSVKAANTDSGSAAPPLDKTAK
jgi:chromosome segregation ATPase